MAMITTHTNSARQSFAIAPVIVSLATMPLTIVRRVRARRELMRLLSQPEYLLKDVGLQRDAITREGMKPFWRS